MERLNTAWRKSSYSANGANCVEAGSMPGLVLVRDTKDKGHGPVLKVPPATWQRFTKSIKG
jgi:hypothetical protein